MYKFYYHYFDTYQNEHYEEFEYLTDALDMAYKHSKDDTFQIIRIVDSDGNTIYSEEHIKLYIQTYDEIQNEINARRTRNNN